MRHNATDKPALTPQQETALAELLAGRSVTEAAAAASVARQTVHTWLRDDYAFQAGYNRGRRELAEAHAARLHALTAIAFDTVEAAMKQGDAKAALTVLRGVGMLTGEPAPIGTDDAEILRKERELSRAREERSRDLEAMIVGL